ncbi:MULTISPECIES: hypothetical protein [unclassified Mesorhizobium]|uniref:hypothetical protein n=1 Tax=unclassified Mesorhizobium TaxID=325217 RepID=UPI001CCB5633|nr:MULTISPECIES: hypothetical protein [unclassified Mesorhizobium]MBZ9682725.1 hypothetical protein [Mesorhizobium sp. CO1-1-2]MBZ9923855.1 hypothetical protein [Mesorhizobium sp. BR1-1-4]
MLAQDYRRGRTLPLKDLPSVENVLLGALNSGSSDEKVRRWAINAIALFGRKESCLEPVKRCLELFDNEPQVVASAISAIFKLDKHDAYQYLKKQGCVTPDLLHLSALQSVSSRALDLSGTKINIDTAPATILKLALVLVGIDKAPDNIFDPRYSNSEIVRVLGSHDEPIVSQYSVWAIAENSRLGTRDLGIDVTALDDHPDNVRSYVYRLFGGESEYSTLKHDIILQGVDDRSQEARAGLAKGIRDSFYEGLDGVILDWWAREKDEEVHQLIVDHFVRQASHAQPYKNLALEIYSAADTRVRERMEAAAATREIYKEFRAKSYNDELGSLFGGGNVTTYNIDKFQSGVTSFGGNATNEGSVSLTLNADQRQQAISFLGAASDAIADLPISKELSDEAVTAIDQAKVEPSKDKLSRVVNTLAKVRDGLSSVAGGAASIAKIGAVIASLSSYL